MFGFLEEIIPRLKYKKYINKWEKIEKKTGLRWNSYLGVEVFFRINELKRIDCKKCFSSNCLDNIEFCKICGVYNGVKNSFSRNELIKDGAIEDELNQLKYLELLRQNPYSIKRVKRGQLE